MAKQRGKIKKSKHRKSGSSERQAPPPVHHGGCLCAKICLWCACHGCAEARRKRQPPKPAPASKLPGAVASMPKAGNLLLAFHHNSKPVPAFAYRRHHTPSRTKPKRYLPAIHAGWEEACKDEDRLPARLNELAKSLMRRGALQLGRAAADTHSQLRGWRLERVVVTREPHEEFMALDSEPRFSRIVPLWHGTPRVENLNSISMQGLRPGRNTCLLGSGIYLTPDLEKAWGFGGWSYNGGFKTILLCLVRPGSVWDTSQPDPDGSKPPRPSAAHCRKRGHDTAFAGAGKHPLAWNNWLRFSEYCVYDPKLVVPAYALLFSRVMS